MITEFMKSLLKYKIEEDLQAFAAKNVQGNRMNTEDIYFAHIVYIDNLGNVVNERYSAFIAPYHNRFLDLIYKKYLFIKGEFTSVSGWYIDNFVPFKNVWSIDSITFGELEEFIHEKSLELKNKMMEINPNYTLKIKEINSKYSLK